MHHGADVDAEHTLGGDADPVRDLCRRHRQQRQHDADEQTGEKRGGRHSQFRQWQRHTYRHRRQ
jgi:hypothetical protein